MKNEMDIRHLKDMTGAILPFRCCFGSGIKDKNGIEIFDGDFLNIDLDAAQVIIGDGSLVRDLITYRPVIKGVPAATIEVKFYLARFWLSWHCSNGSVGLPFDLYDLDAIRSCVSVIRS